MKLSNLFLQYARGGLTINDAIQIWVSKSGDDTNGTGTVIAPYLTITKALASVTSVRKTIFVLAGTYVEAAAMVWPTISGVSLCGVGGLVTISAAGTTQVLSITPGAQADTFDVRIEKADIYHYGTSQDGILINNTGMTTKIVLTLKDVSGDPGDGAGNMIATTHGNADDAIRIYWDGDGGEGIDGSINFTGGNDGDRLYITHAHVAGGIVTSNTAVALDVVLRECLIKHAGITGGNASQTVKIIGCFSETGGTYAVADTGEVTGSQTPTVVGA